MAEINVMTFNIRGSLFEIDGDNVWPNRADLNVRTIRRCNPDIISFQEFQQGNRATYDQQLPAYAVEMGLPTCVTGDYAMYNAIYWKRDRFERIAGGGFYLSETPDTWSTAWDSSLVRAATWIRLRHRLGGASFALINIHLDHIGETARVEGARLCVQRLDALCRAERLPAVVTGDFNSRAWSPEAGDPPAPDVFYSEDIPPAGNVHRVFTQAGYVDTYHAAGHEDHLDTNTYHAFQGSDAPPFAMRIDWILTRDGLYHRFAVHASEIVRDAEPPLYPSDHYPVTAALSLVETDEPQPPTPPPTVPPIR